MVYVILVIVNENWICFVILMLEILVFGIIIIILV